MSLSSIYRARRIILRPGHYDGGKREETPVVGVGALSSHPQEFQYFAQYEAALEKLRQNSMSDDEERTEDLLTLATEYKRTVKSTEMDDRIEIPGCGSREGGIIRVKSKNRY
ncbi:MAG: hypothetical protein M2R45_00317 [Verrucomicrobia subdivision 3 bacterium]|nr:hypothetical protein [Limisphaerales bacterium]MCS1412924.1 hypothetical protein [Limisphaerales bacterium]